MVHIKKVIFHMSGNDSLDSPNSPDKPISHGGPLTILNLQILHQKKLNIIFHIIFCEMSYFAAIFLV